MNVICKICAEEPDSHYFKKIAERRGISTFYMKPSMSKLYKDTEGILSHLDNALAQLQGKKWIIILDGDGFDIRHATEISTGKGMLELIMNKYGATLVEFKLINPSWHMKSILKLSDDNLTEDFKSKLTVIDDRVCNVFQFM